jgi:hypothetical protein
MMEVDIFEIGARLSLHQSLLEHLIADAMSRHPQGAAGLQNLRDAVMGSILDRGAFSAPLSKEDREEFIVQARTVGENFFARTENLRRALAKNGSSPG